MDNALAIIRAANRWAGAAASAADSARVEIARGMQFILNSAPALIDFSAKEFLQVR
jgi:hypothetical protein